MFILDGTPNGLSIISIGVPLAMNGMSSFGIIFDITPLLLCLPHILSPILIDLYASNLILIVSNIFSSLSWFVFVNLLLNLDNIIVSILFK